MQHIHNGAEPQFLYQPTPDESAAVAALSKLKTNHTCALQRARAYAQANQEHVLENFLRYGELSLSQDRPCAGRLIGRPCPQGPGGCIGLCLPEGSDHNDLILRAGEPYAFTMQLYGLDHSTIHSMLEWSDRWGLTMHISARDSWTFPSQSVLLMFRPRGAAE
jgi:hypothetical protein